MNRLSHTLRTSLVAAAVSAALVATAWAQTTPPADAAKSGPKAEQREAHHRDHRAGRGDPMQHMTEKVLRRVKATPEQRAQIQKIMETQGKELSSMHGQHRQQREQALALLSAPTIDTQAVEKLRRDMVAQHDQHSQKMTQVMLAVAQVLTPEQRQLLAKDARHMGDRMGGAMGHAMEGHHGAHPGGQFGGHAGGMGHGAPADKPAGR